MQPDERYDIIESIEQGQKFIYKDEQYMKLPEHVECYGEPANAVNLNTGTMIYIKNDKFIDLETMIVES
ncbi:MAG: hypothetical protein IJZ79_01980 [Bacilli bacterium]|nr:hypothetical protein [Bacilli bacterium]